MYVRVLVFFVYLAFLASMVSCDRGRERDPRSEILDAQERLIEEQRSVLKAEDELHSAQRKAAEVESDLNKARQEVRQREHDLQEQRRQAREAEQTLQQQMALQQQSVPAAEPVVRTDPELRKGQREPASQDPAPSNRPGDR